eukprot:PhF_6_TR30378/c0_g1_i1/m.44513/K01772/hemH, FECH; protoporphyrin/coproporphyrin ferrochelatase
MDARVIDIPFWQRFLLVQGIIAPFRAPTSAKQYRELWSHHGGASPLKSFGIELTDSVQKALGPDYKVALGMRYQNPSVSDALYQLRCAGVTDITILPLFPQYASSSTGSAIECALLELAQWDTIPSLRVISSFVNNPKYIESARAVAHPIIAARDWDKVLISFHGVPRRHVEVSCAYCKAKVDTCSMRLDKVNAMCYRAQCYETARQVAKSLGLDAGEYMVMFQSRLGRAEWLQPYASDVVAELPKQGVRRVVAMSLSFVADCLETTMEIGEEYKEEFMEKGGEAWTLVPSLNVTQTWTECVIDMVASNDSKKW